MQGSVGQEKKIKCLHFSPFLDELRQYLSPYGLILLPIRTIFIKHFFSYLLHVVQQITMFCSHKLYAEYEETSLASVAEGACGTLRHIVL